MRLSAIVLFTVLSASTAYGQQPTAVDAPFLVVLGIGQDAGVPQAGSHDEPGWTDPAFAHFATSLGLVVPQTGEKWLFEATPDFRRQWYELETMEPRRHAAAPDGIFLTHAHIGHYTGLMFLGHESMGASDVSVYVMPEMADFLSTNGPWDQLVDFGNVHLRRMAANVPVELSGGVRVVPFTVPHRQEYSEVVGFRIEGPHRTVLFIPDIDSWEEWDREGRRIEAVLASVDEAFVDGTFFANGEIPGRDMTGFPHPFITHTMERLGSLPAAERAKVHFIHLNHTNPAVDSASSAAERVLAAGFRIARPLERVNL
jgi:pyrroloquinoline quinone biosynthesis protein B